MKTFDLILMLVLFIYLAGLPVKREKCPVWYHFLPITSIFLVAFYTIFEGFKWQSILVYMLATILFFSSVHNVMAILRKVEYRSIGKRWVRITGMIAGILLCFLSIRVMQAFPQFSFPKPTGTYAIGTKYLLFENENKKINEQGEGDKYNRISVKLWYPAIKNDHGRYQYYHTRESARSMASIFNTPGFIFNYLARIKTNTYQDAQPVLSDHPFPLVLYAPSSGINQTSSINEELASQGFVVLSIGHEATEPYIYDPDGNIIQLDFNSYYNIRLRDELYSLEVEQIKNQIINCEKPENKFELQKQLNDAQPFNLKDIKDRASYIDFIIDMIPEINEMLSGIVDTCRIGIYGFSKGGATTGEVCVNNNNIKAGINLDGFMYGDIVYKPLNIPFMFVHSVSSNPDAFINDWFYEGALSDAYMIKINGTTHSNFGDLSLFGGIFKKRRILGPINGIRSVEIQRAFILAFFKKYLYRENMAILDEDFSKYPEVEFYKKN